MPKSKSSDYISASSSSIKEDPVVFKKEIGSHPTTPPKKPSPHTPKFVRGTSTEACDMKKKEVVQSSDKKTLMFSGSEVQDSEMKIEAEQ